MECPNNQDLAPPITTPTSAKQTKSKKTGIGIMSVLRALKQNLQQWSPQPKLDGRQHLVPANYDYHSQEDQQMQQHYHHHPLPSAPVWNHTHMQAASTSPHRVAPLDLPPQQPLQQPTAVSEQIIATQPLANIAQQRQQSASPECLGAPMVQQQNEHYWSWILQQQQQQNMQLPVGWESRMSPTHAAPFYYHKASNTRTWIHPQQPQQNTQLTQQQMQQQMRQMQTEPPLPQMQMLQQLQLQQNTQHTPQQTHQMTTQQPLQTQTQTHIWNHAHIRPTSTSTDAPTPTPTHLPQQQPLQQPTASHEENTTTLSSTTRKYRASPPPKSFENTAREVGAMGGSAGGEGAGGGGGAGGTGPARASPQLGPCLRQGQEGGGRGGGGGGGGGGRRRGGGNGCRCGWHWWGGR